MEHEWVIWFTVAVNKLQVAIIKMPMDDIMSPQLIS